jgi:hypothetical protein
VCVCVRVCVRVCVCVCACVRVCVCGVERHDSRLLRVCTSVREVSRSHSNVHSAPQPQHVQSHSHLLGIASQGHVEVHEESREKRVGRVDVLIVVLHDAARVLCNPKGEIGFDEWFEGDCRTRELRRKGMGWGGGGGVRSTQRGRLYHAHKQALVVSRLHLLHKIPVFIQVGVWGWGVRVS